MYYPPDAKNLRNSEDGDFISVRDVVESPLFEREKYDIPVALGMDGAGLSVSDISLASPMLIGEKGRAPHTEMLWNFIALTALEKSPEDLKLVLIDPLGVDLKFAEKLPHTLLYAHEPQEIIGALMTLEEEILERERMEGGHVPIVVVASNIGSAYALAPELQRGALGALLGRGRAVKVYSLFTLGFNQIAFSRDFAPESTPLPPKLVREPYERDIIGLVEEAAYRNPKASDGALYRKYIAKVNEAKVMLEEYQAKREAVSSSILKHSINAIKLLDGQKEISAHYLQRKLRIGYGTAMKLVKAMLALSIIRKNGGKYTLNTDGPFCEIVN